VIRSADKRLPLAEGGTLDTNLTDSLKTNTSYYGRAVKQPNSVLTLSVPHYQESSKSTYKPIMSIYAPVSLKKQKVTVAVTGLEANYTQFAEKYFIKETKWCPGKVDCDSRLTCDRTQKNKVEGLYCYLLDENGFIVGSNEPEDVGKFFGTVDSKLMAKLILNDTIGQKGVYQVISLPDYQASCKLIAGEGSSANRIHGMYTSIVSLVSWITATAVALLSKFAIYSLFGQGVEQAFAAVENVKYINCVRHTVMYLADLENMQLAFQGNATCGEDLCIRTFAVSRIKKTNLFLLAVESACGKCKSNGKRGNELPGIPGVSKEIIFNRAIYIKPSNNTKIRKRPRYCYPPKDENNSQCGGTISILPCVVLTAITLIISILHNSQVVFL